LAGIDSAGRATFGAILTQIGAVRRPDLALVDVRELGEIRPDLLVCDLDGLVVDKLERLRQVRFVLPSCTIAVYSNDARRSWGLACHLAGATCLLSKASSETELREGLLDALESGCYTDPRFVA
jgi:DNA-binding NarL/FixJ family response regulator